MKLDRLRIVGFKTFVEPTEVSIQPGLTGIVGPNGSGKSNLVEALRWVMGESSHKNMRASGMEDVIFAGATGRPARNSAEVLLALDNSDRRAPAAFNDTDTLEISRRIERDHGSTYRVNGREVRARDVQLLFADAASGARSPALVRQGQISELIAAKPQARRRILEDAAGIGGLAARRHEAELRLKAAEENLVRVEDVLGAIGAQADALRRQERQAQRYRALSAEIRTLEARSMLAGYRAASAESAAAEAEARADTLAVADRTAEQSEAARAEAVAAHELGPLREAEAGAASRLRRLAAERAGLEGEERRARERLADLARRITETERDLSRQEAAARDAADTVARLRAELADVADTPAESDGRRSELEAAISSLSEALAGAEGRLGALQAEVAEIAATRRSAEAACRAEAERAVRLAAEREGAEREIASLSGSAQGGVVEALRAALAEAEATEREAEERAGAARASIPPLRETEERLRAAAAEAERRAARLATERDTLSRLFAAPAGRAGAILDTVTAAPGFETALGAALGDDLLASLDPAAPVAWAEPGSNHDDPALPQGAEPLGLSVTGPTVVARRLGQIGIVPSRADGARLAPALKPGQRLVSREGDLWRWDGYRTAADAPTAAARRLGEKNRLDGLKGSAEAARAEAAARATDAARARAALTDATAAEAEAASANRKARAHLDETRARLARAEREDAGRLTRLATLRSVCERIAASEAETASRLEEARQVLAGLPDGDGREPDLERARAEASTARAVAADRRAELASLVREAEGRAKRRAALEAEVASWEGRASRADAATVELRGRLDSTRRERAELAEAPDDFIRRRRALAEAVAVAERDRQGAADRLAAGQNAAADAGRAARAALEALSTAREKRAASATRADALALRLAELTRAIAETFETDPAGLGALAGLAPGDPAGDGAAIETRLATLRSERERLGGVNLRAEEELADTQGREAELTRERDDLAEALKRLRHAIGDLNREGRERLLAAFGVVDGHFRRLFTSLFGGGAAELTLTESDDPLEAGLEILVSPPGRKPTLLSLLSGGEQALTATALIFAVFLTNPSPVCVMDEVDAPLDDANVERFCDLIATTATETGTRFLVITHNPITMARMDRLFGVTMADKGISQLVSVDLGTAERLLEAV